MCATEIQYITKEIPKDKVYDLWIEQINKIEQSTISTSIEDQEETSQNSLDIGFKLFPIIDSIALNLFERKSGRRYLQELGYTNKEAHMIYWVFRNGIIHSTSPYSFEYNNGIISWGMSSSSGSGGFSRHYDGYEDLDHPEDNVPADRAFEYVRLGENSYHASLSLDRLAAHIKYDLEQRKTNDHRDSIEFVVGQKIDENIPSVEI